MDNLYSISGENLDLILDMLEDDECDTAVALEREGKQLIDDSSFSCDRCGKGYKTQAGLKRHLKTCKIVPVLDELDLPDLIKKMLEEAKTQLDCYPETLQKELRSYDVPDVATLSQELRPLILSYIRKKDPNAFLAKFYSKIILNSEKFMADIAYSKCSILPKRLSDKLKNFFANGYQKDIKETNVKPIDEREIHGLEYLGGYVVHKLMRKAKRKKEHEKALLIQNLMATEENHFFINSINRGGLTTVKAELLQIFIIIQETFRQETLSLSLKKIDVKKIFSAVLSNSNTWSLYSSLLSNDADEDLKDKLLKEMISLFTTVRAFSLSRDIVDKNKKDKASAFKEKALRKKLAEQKQN